MADDLIKLYQTINSSNNDFSATSILATVSSEAEKRPDSPKVASSGPTPCQLIGPASTDSARCPVSSARLKIPVQKIASKQSVN